MDDATHEDWKNGGERREMLEIALIEVLKSHGAQNNPSGFKKIKASWGPRVGFKGVVLYS